MKRLVTILVLTLLVLASAATSADAQLPFSYGFKAGINSSNVVGDDADGYKSRTGIVGGLFVRFNIPGKFSVQTELLYSRKGAKRAEVDTAAAPASTITPFTRVIKADYLEVPVLIRYKLAARGPVSTHFFAGPVLAFSKSSETVVEVIVLDRALAGPRNNYNEKSTDIGLVLGGGIDVSVMSVGVSLDIRYTTGLSSMWEDVDIANLPDPLKEDLYADPTTGTAFDMKNSALTFTVGVTF
jgi:hypothetical protein